MATSTANNSQKAAKNVECQVCSTQRIHSKTLHFSVITDPTTLPCVHVICLKCFKTYKEDELPNVSCPLCKTFITFPKQGVGALSNNSRNNNMLETFCDLCLQDRKIEAAYYCVECEEQFCALCCKAHVRSKLTKDHRVVTIANKPRSKTINLYIISFIWPLV